MNFNQMIYRGVKTIAENRLSYLVVTSAILLTVHFPYSLSLILAWQIPELFLQLIHLVVGTAWILGFIPQRAWLTARKKLTHRYNQFKPRWQKLMSAYALVH